MRRPRPRRGAAGFTLVELLVVVAIIAVVAAIALPSYWRARITANEGSAIGSLRSIHTAQAAYSAICAQGGFAQTLNDLALPPIGSAQGFIAADMASNGVMKAGYISNIAPDVGAVPITAPASTCNNSGAAAVSHYFAEVHPIAVGSSGERTFAVATDGAIFFRTDGVTITPGMAGAFPLQ